MPLSKLELAARAARVAAIAVIHAEEVDLLGRFPDEALTALKDEGLLGMMVPADLGGGGGRPRPGGGRLLRPGAGPAPPRR